MLMFSTDSSTCSDGTVGLESLDGLFAAQLDVGVAEARVAPRFTSRTTTHLIAA